MHARAAYVRSLGTTSILVAASLLMLLVVGAVVGFHRWPQGAVGQQTPSVPLEQGPPTLVRAVTDVRKAPAARVRKTRPARRGGSTAGLVKVVHAPRPVGHPVALTPGTVRSSSPAPAPPAPARLPAPPPSPPSAPSLPSDPQQIEALVTGLVGSLPPVPGASVRLPLTDVSVTVP